jgi:hypothetical protein
MDFKKNTMKYKLLILLILFYNLSCSKKQSEKILIKRIQIKRVLEFSVPGNIEFLENMGIDSYVFILQMDSMKLIGECDKNYTYKVTESLYHYYDIEDKDSILKNFDKHFDSTKLFFSETPEIDRNLFVANKNYFFYDTINGLSCRFVMPKKIGTGLTGVYISTLDSGYSFSLYGKNLDSASHKLAVEIMKTVKPVK